MMACASPTQATQPMTTQTTAAPKFGTMIPSRIFVGGIDFKVRIKLILVFEYKTHLVFFMMDQGLQCNM